MAFVLAFDCLGENHFPSWDEQLAWEAEYGEQCSFALDWKIFVSVFKHLIRRNNDHYGEQFRESLLDERKTKEDHGC